MPKKRIIISQDYDGCYSIVTDEGLNAELNGPNHSLYLGPKGEALRARLEKMPQQYNNYLTQITEGANAVSVYVGSDRQSFTTDRINQAKHNNGSVYPALRALCAKRTTEMYLRVALVNNLRQ